MTTEDVQKFIDQMKPMLAGCNLEVVQVVGKEVQLKLKSADLGTFKVQGKIINASDEVKKNIEKQFAEKFPEAVVTFI